jgi:hypothetical protein
MIASFLDCLLNQYSVGKEEVRGMPDDPKNEIILKLKNLAMKRCAERIEKSHRLSDDLVMNVQFATRNEGLTIIMKRNHGL